jgi:hypothetical protein
MGETQELIEITVKQNYRWLKGGGGKAAKERKGETVEEGGRSKAKQQAGQTTAIVDSSQVLEEGAVFASFAEEVFVCGIVSAITALWLATMTLVFKEREGWENLYECFYFVYITSMSIGFGDYAPTHAQNEPSTFVWILGALLWGSLWLSLSGVIAGKVAYSALTRKGTSEALQRDYRGIAVAVGYVLLLGPLLGVSAVKDIGKLQPTMADAASNATDIPTLEPSLEPSRGRVFVTQPVELVYSVIFIGSLGFILYRIRQILHHDRGITRAGERDTAVMHPERHNDGQTVAEARPCCRRCQYSCVLRPFCTHHTPTHEESNTASLTTEMTVDSGLSFALLGLILSAAAVVLHCTEYRLAKDSADEFWASKNQLLSDFRAASTRSNSTSLEQEVAQAMSLLNEMGTCSAPPQELGEMEWQLHNGLYYAFVTVSTIGYGDTNVQTKTGR